MSDRLVVVGASLAGLRAVQAARKAGFTGPITLVGAEEHLPYDRPPLSKEYLNRDEPKDPTFRSHDEMRNELAVDLRLSTWATGLNSDDKVLSLRAPDSDHELTYNSLIIATGATARTLPGAHELSGVHTLRTLNDAIAVRAALDRGAHTVVVGAGFIGSEVASGARKRGLPVTILEALPVPLVRSVGEDMGRACAQLHRDNGTDLRCGVKVTGLDSTAGKVTGVTWTTAAPSPPI